MSSLCLPFVEFVVAIVGRLLATGVVQAEHGFSISA
jgi:hypothetical protein